MRFPQVFIGRAQATTGIVGITGAAPQTVAGKSLDSGLVGTNLVARAYAKSTTSTLALTGKWQVLDDDGSTWQDVIESNAPTPTALITGTGSAASIVKFVTAPQGAVAGSRLIRFVIVSSGASGGGAGTDEASIAYDYRMPASVGI